MKKGDLNMVIPVINRILKVFGQIVVSVIIRAAIVLLIFIIYLTWSAALAILPKI